MRLVWVSFDVMGSDCLAAAAEAGAEVAAIVTLPGPIDPDRSGQCSFDEIAAELGARVIETADVNSPETIAAVREADPDLTFVVGWSQLVLDEFIGIPRQGVFGMHPTLLPRHRGRAAIPWAILSGLAKTGVTLFEISDGTADSGPIRGRSPTSARRRWSSGGRGRSSSTRARQRERSSAGTARLRSSPAARAGSCWRRWKARPSLRSAPGSDESPGPGRASGRRGARHGRHALPARGRAGRRGACG